MNTKLNYVQDWLPLAQQSNWSVAELAKRCNVSVRTLERHFLMKMNKSPKAWLTEQRQKEAMKLLHNGSSIKEIASHLGYKHAHHFSREFKGHWGCCPAAQTGSTRQMANDCRILV